ncbi:uncharacterized protein Z518_03410 [Rhinocladiella mackenziei CBS 650.93]|uniref:Shikimate dehydrogenase substrate binding N-terminal domain-containing protein n=1 Tax=Rhinocladiella mackenziei CBS 650.93 TaxID=1442369 RepID=A0A0D2HDW4_9EURO|nr:uncharacterized protein Z518_03410 [Rhinocladiella mackenziei CBS 650.93]KIX08753.1 hypothetical protein Z518_03410 [Rhinocladiella mackenziei CBS 650.93]
MGVSDARHRLYIAGGPGGSSIAPPAHEFIARSLGKDWTMDFLQLNSPTEVIEIYRRPDFRGGVVTMPHKRSIIPMIDEVDNYVRALSACNLIYPDLKGRLCGTNTDWIGISESILVHEQEHLPGRIALVYGAGGAARAAIYALLQILKCSQVYVINRDSKEVEDQVADVSKYNRTASLNVLHIQTVNRASTLSSPHFIVSTVPDQDAITEAEAEARKILVEFLSRESKGLLVDMCYHPLRTRNVQLAEENGWRTVNGIEVIGYQLKTQWSFFGSPEIPDRAAEFLQALAKDYDSRNVHDH